MPITVVFAPPLPSDSPEVFNSKAFSTLGDLNNWSTQANALASDVTSKQTTASDAATTATTQADLANSSRIAAQDAAAAAAASYDSFDDRYLGSKSADPTLDNDGNALVEGALYWNSTAKEMRAYNGTAWVTTSVANAVSRGGDTMTGPLSVPAGATGDQVPRRSEVVGIAGTETITGAKTFTTRQVIADPVDQGGMATASQTLGGLEIRGNGAGMAAIALHRVNAYFAYLGLDADNALAIGGGSFGAVRRRIYHEDNILGTVSQSGGVPTGAIFENGSNANGFFVRFADGTQIIRRTVNSNSAGEVGVLFPASFSSTPNIFLTANTTSPVFGTFNVPDANGFALAGWLDTGARATITFNVLAVGRWF